MGVAALDDERLREFIKDPSRFIQDEKNFLDVFGLSDPAVRSRVEKLQKELWESPEGVEMKRSLAAG